MKKYNHCLALLGLSLLMLFFAGCSKEEDQKLDLTQGSVSFHFVKNTVYVLGDLEEIATVKITLENQGVQTVLPSLDLNGDESLLSTKEVRLAPGEYTIISYKAFNAKGNLVIDAEPEKENTFQVSQGGLIDFSIPVEVKSFITANNIRNVLYAMATEVLGEDRSNWPPSWNEDNDMDTWEGLFFEYDDYGNISYLTEIVIDGDGYSDFEFPDATVERRHGLPEFKHMKKLSSAIVNLSSVASLTIRNCDLEELPTNMNESNLGTLHIENTHLKALPASMGGMKKLGHLFLKHNALTAFPTQICQIKTLQALDIIDEQISSLPDELSNLDQLVSLRINQTAITAVPDVFEQIPVSTLDLSGNSNLASLPSSVGSTFISATQTKSKLHALILDNCSFTQIPVQAVRSGMRYLSLINNKLTQVNASDIQAMTDLHTLTLDGNRFSSFPTVQNSSLRMLSLINCGLQRSQVNLTGTQVADQWLLLTAQDYQNLFGTTYPF